MQSSSDPQWAEEKATELVAEFVDEDMVPDDVAAEIDRLRESDPIRALETVLDHRR
jgi:hypothetical protein